MHIERKLAMGFEYDHHQQEEWQDHPGSARA